MQLIRMSQQKAHGEWKKWKEALPKTKDKKIRKQIVEMRRYYNHLKCGRKIIDVFEVFKKAGVDSKGRPRLAIAPISENKTFCTTYSNGSMTFHTDLWKRSLHTSVTFPIETIPVKPNNRETITTGIPNIPNQFIPKTTKGYWILWECKDWQPMKDPLLLKRLSRNLFVVLAAWKLTSLEASIISGKGAR